MKTVRIIIITLVLAITFSFAISANADQQNITTDSVTQHTDITAQTGDTTLTTTIGATTLTVGPVSAQGGNGQGGSGGQGGTGYGGEGGKGGNSQLTIENGAIRGGEGGSLDLGSAKIGGDGAAAADAAAAAAAGDSSVGNVGTDMMRDAKIGSDNLKDANIGNPSITIEAARNYMSPPPVSIPALLQPNTTEAKDVKIDFRKLWAKNSRELAEMSKNVKVLEIQLNVTAQKAVAVTAFATDNFLKEVELSPYSPEYMGDGYIVAVGTPIGVAAKLVLEAQKAGSALFSPISSEKGEINWSKAFGVGLGGANSAVNGNLSYTGTGFSAGKSGKTQTVRFEASFYTGTPEIIYKKRF